MLRPYSLACLWLLAAVSWALAHAAAASPAVWPQFRGPGGSGISPGGPWPTHFGPQSNLVWKVPVPSGHSSPCIWGERIFLTGFESNRLVTLALDRRNGRLLWRRELEPVKLERGAPLGSPATATPATDGQHLAVYFGSFGLACYSFEGAELWRKPLPPPITQHGPGTSPVLAGHRLILQCDQDMDSYLLAVDVRTGQTLWRTDRPGFRRGFSTPLPWPATAPELVVAAGTLRLIAYDLRQGTVRWWVRGLPNEMVASPIAGEDLIFVAGWTHGAGVSRLPSFTQLLQAGDRNADGQLSQAEATGPARAHFGYIDADKDGLITRAEYEAIAAIFNASQNVCLAIRPGGQGDVTESMVVWKQTRGLPYVPTPLCYEGRVYLVKNGGLASCFDARTDQVHYLEERLGALGDYYASPVAGAGKLCAVSHQGVAVVFEAGDTLRVLARNPLGEQVLATPAIVDGTLYIRSKTSLWAFTESAAR
jgi:outer membrane protein assembly factor BamB